MENSTLNTEFPQKGIIRFNFGIYHLMSMVVFIACLSYSQLYAQTISLEDSLVAYYNFEENTGTDVADISGNAYNGYFVGDVNWVSGKFGSAVEFLGTNNSHVEVPESVLLDGLIFDVADSWTVSLWLKIPAIPTVWTTILAKSRDVGNHYGLWMAPNGGAESWTYGGWPNFGGPVTDVDVWTHVVVVQDGAAVTLTGYVNGVLDLAFPNARPITGAGDLWIGGGKTVNEWLVGSVDDVRIYNRALSSEDVAALHLYVPSGVGLNDQASNNANSFVLDQNYPNPFNHSTNVSFNLPKKSEVNISVYNILGQKVATLVNEVSPAGRYKVQFDDRNLDGGVYICKMNVGNQVFIRKMQVVK